MRHMSRQRAACGSRWTPRSARMGCCSAHASTRRRQAMQAPTSPSGSRQHISSLTSAPSELEEVEDSDYVSVRIRRSTTAVASCRSRESSCSSLNSFNAAKRA
eukprot:3442537-Prymnesium_polylepis.1